jgi:hypothetical protein
MGIGGTYLLQAMPSQGHKCKPILCFKREEGNEIKGIKERKKEWSEGWSWERNDYSSNVHGLVCLLLRGRS